MVPWDHFRVPGYPIRDPRDLYTLKIFFFYNNLLSCAGKFKILSHKIKGLNFSWCWKPFLATQFLKMAQNVADFFGFSIRFMIRLYKNIFKTPRYTKTQVTKNWHFKNEFWHFQANLDSLRLSFCL